MARFFLALRKNPGQLHSLGYATCGGHCSDPYHAQLAAAVDLEHEFGLSLKDSSEISALKMINKSGDVAVFVVEIADLEVEKFSPSEREFVKGSGDVVSFKEIRDRKLPLRNIPSLDLYLKFCEKELEVFAKEIAVRKILVPSSCVASDGGVVQFPKDNFGAIEFYGDDLEALSQRLKDRFGGEVKLDRERGCAIIDDVNPAQIIALFKAEKTKEDLEKYRHYQAEKAREWGAAMVIQSAFRQQLSRQDLDSGSGVEIKGYSAINLRETRQGLRSPVIVNPVRDGGFSLKSEFAQDLQQKPKEQILSQEERILFEAFCRMPLFLYHATCSEVALAIENNDHILSPIDIGRYGVETGDGLYESIGLGRNICFSVGSRDFESPYFKVGDGTPGMRRDVLFRMDLNSLLTSDREFAHGAWLGETLIRFFRPDYSINDTRIGDTIFRSLYLGEGESRARQLYYRANGDKLYLDEVAGSKICEAKDLVKFLGYQLIKNLRLIDGTAREYLLAHPEDERALALVADRIFSNIGMVCYVPTKMRISNPAAKTEKFELSELIQIASLTIEAIERGDLGKLEELKAECPDLARHLKLIVVAGERAPNPRNYFNYAIVHSMRSGQDQSLKWLIENGFFDETMADFNSSGGRSDLMQEVLEVWKDVAAANKEVGRKIAMVFEEKQIFTPRLLAAFPQIFYEDPSLSLQSGGAARLSSAALSSDRQAK